MTVKPTTRSAEEWCYPLRREANQPDQTPTTHPSLLFEEACLLDRDIDAWHVQSDEEEPLAAYLVRIGWRKANQNG